MSTFCQRLYHRKSQNLVNVVCERPHIMEFSVKLLVKYVFSFLTVTESSDGGMGKLSKNA